MGLEISSREGTELLNTAESAKRLSAEQSSLGTESFAFMDIGGKTVKEIAISDILGFRIVYSQRAPVIGQLTAGADLIDRRHLGLDR